MSKIMTPEELLDLQVKEFNKKYKLLDDPL
jgi:hypothetical protein